jgi:hypothetical protein
MENLGDLIYIVVLAVIGLGSLLSAGKKKKAEEEMSKQQSPPDIVTPQTASDRDFWDILTGQEEERPPVTAKSKTQNKPPKSLAAENIKTSPFLTGESEIARTIRKQASTVSALEEEDVKEPLVTAEDFNDPESLRKTVIYSEILNRKY